MLVIFALFCRRVTKASSFWPPTKNCIFRQELTVFSQKRMQLVKTVSSCRKMQFFVGGQNELALVTLLQNSAKITKIRQTEDILGKFGLQASSCIHFWLKTVSSCRKMPIFVGGQNELTLVTLLQNSVKIIKFLTLKTFWVNLVFKHLVASIFG